jgi:hypothetical protein
MIRELELSTHSHHYSRPCSPLGREERLEGYVQPPKDLINHAYEMKLPIQPLEEVLGTSLFVNMLTY